MKFKFSSTDIRNIFRYQNSVKIRPVGAEFLHADGQTDTTMLTVAFRNFANAPKNIGGAYGLPSARFAPPFHQFTPMESLHFM